jgi:hypothetical protein
METVLLLLLLILLLGGGGWYGRPLVQQAPAIGAYSDEVGLGFRAKAATCTD